MGANLEGYFDNLAAAAMNEKQVLEDLIKSMSKVTVSNEVLTNTNAALTHQLEVLQNMVCGPAPTPPSSCGGANWTWNSKATWRG